MPVITVREVLNFIFECFQTSSDFSKNQKKITWKSQLKKFGKKVL